jgi:copper homeostasis protein CutC
MTVEQELQEAIEATQAATALVREQEDKIATMKAAGVDTSRAEALLAAYRAAAHLAADRRDWLQTQREAKAG